MGCTGRLACLQGGRRAAWHATVAGAQACCGRHGLLGSLSCRRLPLCSLQVGALRQVVVDVPRTAPGVAFVHEPVIQKCLERLLYIWGVRHPASGYVQVRRLLRWPGGPACRPGNIWQSAGAGCAAVQGYTYHSVTPLYIHLPPSPHHASSSPPAYRPAPPALLQGMNDLVTPFLAVFLSEVLGPEQDTWQPASLSEEALLEVEADCYWCLCKLLEGIQDHYTDAQPGIQKAVFKLKELVRWAGAGAAAGRLCRSAVPSTWAFISVQ